MRLLSSPTSNPKVAKNKKKGVLTAPLHLLPYNLSGFQVCPMASKGCAAACLNTAGRGGFLDRVQAARLRKTLMYFNDRQNFMIQLIENIKYMERKAEREGLGCGIRLNATSDIPWERVMVDGQNLMEMFPNVQFYDYTAIPKRAIAWARGELPPNYHLTFSAKEDNDEAVKSVANEKGNIAVVFRDKLPNEYLGLPVINGDEHDYRPIDPVGCIVGLKAKGKAKKDKSGFVK